MQGILVMDDDDNGMNGTHGRAEQSRAEQGSRTPVNDSGHMLVSRSIDRSSFEVPLKGGTK